METGVTAVRLGWIAYVVPFIFVLSPALLWQGSGYAIAEGAITAFIGVWFGSCGLIGYMFGPQGMIGRVLLFVAGILLLLPADAIANGLLINGIGLAIGVIWGAKDYLANPKKKAAAEAGAGE